jgi:hypothetical protein
MPRPAKYKTVDDLINNCTIQGDCFIWPSKAGAKTSPVISPYSPMTRVMGTNSVARILFTVTRHIPVSGRLVKWCRSHDCVNPYHFTEERSILAKRVRSGKFFALLPEQELVRELYPLEEDVLALKARDPEVLTLLMNQASVNPYDGKNLPPAMRIDKIVPVPLNRVVPPVLTMTRTKSAASQSAEEAGKAADDWFSGDIFRQIADRKKRMLEKT